MQTCSACGRRSKRPTTAPAGHVVVFMDRTVDLPAGAPVCWRCHPVLKPEPRPQLTQVQIDLIGALLRRGRPPEGEERELVARAFAAA